MRRIVSILALILTLAMPVSAQIPGTRTHGGPAGEAPPAPSNPTITTTGLPSCVVGQAFNADVIATGGSGTYSSFVLFSGAFPDGDPAFDIDLVSNVGNITGTPDTEGAATFVILVADSNGLTDTQEYTVFCVEAGSGELRSGHPRFLITPAGDPGVGTPLDEWRTQIDSFYAADFNTFINSTNLLATDPTGKGSATQQHCNTACSNGIAFALLAMADPGVMTSYTWQGRTKSDYLTAAKAHVLYIAEQMQRATNPWRSSQDSEQLIDKHFPQWSLAIIYDWTMAAGATYTDAEKREILEAAIDGYDERNPRSSETFFFVTVEYEMSAYGGLAFDNEEIPSGSHTSTEGNTKTYLEWVEAMRADAYYDMMDTTGGVVFRGFQGHSEFYMITGHDNTVSASNKEGNSYNEQAGQSYPILYLTFASVFNLNVAANNAFFDDQALWTLWQLRPVAWQPGVNRRYNWRFGVSTPASSFDSSTARFSFYGYGNITNDANMRRVMRWATEEFSNLGTVGTNTNAHDTRIAYWPFWHLLYGLKHVGAAMSPDDANVPLSQAMAMGRYFFRSGWGSEDDTVVTFQGPQKIDPSGHWRLDYSSFGIEKFGIVTGGSSHGQNKGVSGNINFQSESVLDQNMMHVVMPGETGGYKPSFSAEWGETGGMSYPKVASGSPIYCSASFQYQCNMGLVSKLSINGEVDGYDYLNYTYTNMWNPLKVSFSNREFLFIRGATNHEYLITLDRVTAVDPNYRKFWNIKLPETPSSSETLTNIELGAGFALEQGGVWTTPSSATWTMVNDIEYNGEYQSHAKLFMKSMLPTGTWRRISGDFYEQRTTEGLRPIERSGAPIASSTSGATSTVVITSGSDSADNNAFVLIQGTGDANLDGYRQVTRVSSDTFTVTCSPSNCAGTGAGGYMIQKIDTWSGKESFGNARLEMQPSTLRASDLFITVLQWGDSDDGTFTAMSPLVTMCSDTLGETCSGSITGVQIDDSVQQMIVLWSTSTTGAAPTLPATITPTLTGSIRVLLFNLTASTNYYYKADAAGSIEFRTSTFTGATEKMTNAGGVLDFTYTR